MRTTTTTKTRLTSLLLALIMVFSMVPLGAITAFAADTPSYVALGDSISTGYGLTTPASEGFTYLLTDDLGYTLTNLAVDGNTAAGVLTQLSDETVKTAVTNADLITITAGGNDLMALLYQAIATEYNTLAIAEGAPITADEVLTIMSSSTDGRRLTVMSIALGLLNSESDDIYMLDDQAFTDAITAYIITLNQVMSKIRALNETAPVIVATQYNPYVEFSGVAIDAVFSQVDLTPVCSGMETGVTALNTAIKNNAAIGGYIVADVKAAFDTTHSTTNDLYVADPESLEFDFHPNAAGHAIIADTFAAAVPMPEIYVGGVGMADDTYLANGATATTTTAPASGGYAYYENGTLTLNNYSYSGEGYWYSNDYSSVIYAPVELEIVLVGQSSLTNTVDDADGITSNADLTISGSGSIDINATYGIYAYSGDVTVSGGTLNINAEDGIADEGGSVSFNGGMTVIDARGGYSAVSAGSGIIFIDGIIILEPSDAYIKDDGEQICNSDGDTAIYVVIGASGTTPPTPPSVPEIYVGGVGMADGDYLANGATSTTTTVPTGGYAYYKDGVLTLNNYEYEGEGHWYDNYYSSVIYAPVELEIVLVGQSTVTNTADDADGITSEADLTFSGDGRLDINATYGIYAWDGSITVENGRLGITGESTGIYAEDDITINGGIMDIAAKDGIVSEFGSVYFNGGTTTVDSRVENGSPVTACVGINFNEEKGIEILEPEDADIYTFDDGDIAFSFIQDSDGNWNIRAVIGTKGTQNAPTGLVGVAETISGKQDGKITGASSAMEYRKDGENTYTAITGNTVENLAAGKYYVRVKGDDNHNPSAETEVIIAAGGKLTVTLPQNQIGYTLTAGKTELEWHGNTTLAFGLADGYSKTAEFSVSATGATLTDNGNGTYTISNAEDNVTVTVNGVADTTAPEAEISISTNRWTEFLNDITFGLFFKETQDVTITATDKGSGVDKIYYLISDDKFTEEEVETLADVFWKKYDAANKPSISPDKECIVYVKVIDEAQNVKVISSDGLVFDATAPTLEGIENGKTYYGDMTVIIPADQFGDIEQVTLDGETMSFAEGTYGRIPADNAEHTVVATDKAGNKTEYNITVYKIYEVTFKHPTFDFGFPVNHGASFNDAHPDTVQDMVAAKEHHTFIGWYESTDGGETLKDTPYDFDANVTGDVTLYPMFEKTTYTVDIGECHYVGCVISGGGSYQHGQTVTLTASPADDTKFEYWLDTSVQLSDEPTQAELRTAIVSYDATYTFTAEKDVSLEAVFSGSEEIGIMPMLITGTDAESLFAAEWWDVEYDFGTIIPGAESIVLPGEHIDDITTVGGKQYRFVGFITFGYDEATDTETVELKETLTIGTMPLYGSAEYYEWFVPISDGVYAAYMPHTSDNPKNPNSPQMGDTANLWLWFTLLLVSGGVAITLTVYDRKRRIKKN